MLGKGYLSDDSEIGKVYYPSKGVICDDEIEVLYERKPWLEAFRVVGIRPVLEKRSGPGTLELTDFERLTGEFCDLVRKKNESPGRYFLRMTEHYCRLCEESSSGRKGSSGRISCSMFMGFVENMWREGDAWTGQLVDSEILPVISRSSEASELLRNVASEDFARHINSII